MSKSETPTCCFCCHVRVGTFVLALLVLVNGLLCVVVSSIGLSHVYNTGTQYNYVTVDDEGEMYQDFASPELSSTTFWLGIGIGMCILIIAAGTIYGLMKKRSGFLIPLFILQLFHFIRTTFRIGRMIFYWPAFRLTIESCQHMPDEWKNWLLGIDDRWLAAIVFGILFTILFIESYLISMVYRCYKYIMQQALRERRDPEISFVADPGTGPIYKPPKYDDIQKVPLVSDVEVTDTKPPPYSA